LAPSLSSRFFRLEGLVQGLPIEIAEQTPDGTKTSSSRRVDDPKVSTIWR
jgi:hypothetical protein